MNKKGFTLIELVIVISMTALVSMAVYALFNNGVKVWKVVNQQSPQEDVGIAFDKLSRDLTNSTKFSGISFQGSETSIGFPALVICPSLGGIRGIAEVNYSYDPESGKLIRRQKDFSQIFSREDGQSAEIIKNIRSLRFYYYYLDSENNEYSWRKDWLPGAFPLAVRVELELEHGVKDDLFVETVSIPCGG